MKSLVRGPPASKLFLGFPAIKSSPQYLRTSFLGSTVVSPLAGTWDAVWSALNLDINSVASLAAFVARVLGITLRASLNSEMAICSLLLNPLQNWSKWMLKATSTAPPPATTLEDSRVLLATQIESWRDLN